MFVSKSLLGEIVVGCNFDGFLFLTVFATLEEVSTNGATNEDSEVHPEPIVQVLIKWQASFQSCPDLTLIGIVTEVVRETPNNPVGSDGCSA